MHDIRDRSRFDLGGNDWRHLGATSLWWLGAHKAGLPLVRVVDGGKVSLCMVRDGCFIKARAKVAQGVHRSIACVAKTAYQQKVNKT